MSASTDGPVEFVTSSFCTQGACVEIGRRPNGRVVVRHGGSADGPAVEFTAQEWAVFVQGVKNGEFD